MVEKNSDAGKSVQAPQSPAAATAMTGGADAAPSRMSAVWWWLGWTVRAIFVVSTLLLILRFALREYTWAGATLVAAVLAAAAATCALLTRKASVGLLVFCLPLIAIDVSDILKKKFLFQTLSFYDFLIVGTLPWADMKELAVRYAGEVPNLPSILGGALLVIVVALLAERQIASHSPAWRRYPALAVSAVCLALGATALISSRYLDVVGSQNIPFNIHVPSPVRLSHLVVSGREHARLATLAGSSGAAPPAKAASQPEPCRDCPDIVIVHVELTFDPRIVSEFSGSTGLMQSLEKHRHGTNGLLKVNIWGGFSWISEFEILCGIDHRLFGKSGTAPMVAVSPFTRNCLPSYLKTLGYQTYAVYPTSRTWLNVASAFRRYGIDKMYDVRDLKISNYIAWTATDEPFVDKALEILREPRTHPRLIFVSTMWNHGPHGAAHAKKQIFQGPFDISQTQDPKLKDFVNRLNDTHRHLQRLEAEAAKKGFPVATVLYGDHQPGFALNFTDPIRKAFADDARFITFYRMTDNRRSVWDRDESVVRIEELGIHMLQKLKLPISPAMEKLLAISKRCVKRLLDCHPSDRLLAIRAITSR